MPCGTYDHGERLPVQAHASDVPGLIFAEDGTDGEPIEPAVVVPIDLLGIGVVIEAGTVRAARFVRNEERRPIVALRPPIPELGVEPAVSGWKED